MESQENPALFNLVVLSMRQVSINQTLQAPQGVRGEPQPLKSTAPFREPWYFLGVPPSGRKLFRRGFYCLTVMIGLAVDFEVSRRRAGVEEGVFS